MQRKYCRCGHTIDLEPRWDGQNWDHTLPYQAYRDAEESSPTFGQLLSDRCPGCGESVTSFHDDGFLLDEPPVEAALIVGAEKDQEIEKLEARVAELERVASKLLTFYERELMASSCGPSFMVDQELDYYRRIIEGAEGGK